MKKIYLKIITTFMILFSILVNCSYANSNVLDNDEQENEGPVHLITIAASSESDNGRTSGSFSGGSGNNFKEQSIDEVISGADNFIDNADTNNTISQDNLQKTIDLIYNILLAIGLVVAVTAGVVLGIEFMVSSADGQAQVKEKLIPYVVGCVIIFGAFGIWKLVMVLLQGF